MSEANHAGRRRPFRRGEMVQVRGLKDVLATLDSDGKVEGLPFMPEMAKYCGQTLRVFRRVENVFLDNHYYVARLTGTVLLEDVRCDGGSHGGCQMACLILWKEAWLDPPGGAQAAPAAEEEKAAAATRLLSEKDGRFYCQATELIGATTRLPWWDVRQYLRNLVLRETSLGQLLQMVALIAYNKFQAWRGGEPYGMVAGDQQKTVAESLALQPGEMVEVKSRAEIETTLDAEGKNRGLAFVPDMLRYCGKRCRVSRRVDRMIIEWTGQMRDLKNTVALEGVTCSGIVQRRCPRNCFHLWRETWLKRVS